MSAFVSDSENKKKTVLRRGGGNRPVIDPLEEAPRFYPENPRPKTGHDLYLTYDMNGKLRTHTVYRAPKSEVTPPKRPGKLTPKEQPPLQVEVKNPDERSR